MSGNRGDVSAVGELAQERDTQGQPATSKQPIGNDKTDAKQGEASPLQTSSSVTTETVGAYPAPDAEQQRAQADLQAQQDMAFWAMLMFFATLATVIVTAIGVWFVKRTLDATLRAVEDTGEATEAMREANRIAAINSVHQFRPYLGTLGAAVIDAVGHSPRVVIDIKNFGHSPARIIDQDFRLVHFMRTASDAPKRIFYEVPLQKIGLCDPGHTQNRSAILHDPIAVLDGDRLFAELTITYKSFDGTIYWRRMSYLVNHLSTWPGGGKVMMDVHESGEEDGEGQPPPSFLEKNPEQGANA